MRFSLASVAACVLAQCSAFTPITSLNRQGTVVENTLRAKWTMNPDEPTPEVCPNFHVASLHVVEDKDSVIVSFAFLLVG